VALPKISIVTPTLNQAEFIGETLRSVLDQGYPDLEYIVVDGGSTDGTAEVVAPFLPRIARWVSEPDKGQADAVNKGLRSATGEIMAWINSDDWYQPGALERIGRHFERKPECDWLAAAVENVFPDHSRLMVPRYSGAVDLIGRKDYTLHQPGIFWRRSMFEKLGPFEDRLHFSFDHEYWVRAAMAGYEPDCIGAPVVNFRIHGASKTMTRQDKMLAEDWWVARRYKPRLSSRDWCRARASLLHYEAGYYAVNAYGFLARGDRAGAMRYLLRRIAVTPCVHPNKLVWGAFWRVFVTGKPPVWFGK
jgi:glycosyltransferase involved in cell wall biosynthesis